MVGKCLSVKIRNWDLAIFSVNWIFS